AVSVRHVPGPADRAGSYVVRAVEVGRHDADRHDLRGLERRAVPRELGDNFAGLARHEDAVAGRAGRAAGWESSEPDDQGQPYGKPPFHEGPRGDERER